MHYPSRPRSPSAENQGVNTTPVAALQLLKMGTMFDSRYRMSRHLGTGSLCSTYVALDQKTGDPRVVKILQPRKEVSSTYTDDFLFLARSLAHYQHPGIAKIYDSGRIDNDVYYTMEKLEGKPLRAWLLERLTFSERVPPGLAVLRALIGIFKVIHERGCYGVLKPENVFLHPTRGPVVTDFGVPGFLSPQEFEFNAHARRYLPYMAPELRRDWSNLLPQSDIYSLGALLYEILVGRAPTFPLKVLPSEASAFFNVETDEVVLKAMAANPFDRFDSPDQFEAALSQLEATLPIPTGSDTAIVEANTGTHIIEIGQGKEPETATELPVPTWSPGMVEARTGTAILPTGEEIHDIPLAFDPGSKTVLLPEAQIEHAFVPAHAATREMAAASLPLERKTEPLPILNASSIVDGDEPIPMMIWILIGMLSLAVCILAAILGKPVH